MKYLFCFTLILTFSHVVSAGEYYQGIRQMGMGGAAIAVVNDETALLLNPIGLGRLREPYITLIDPEVTTNLKGLKTTQDLGLIGGAEIDKVYDSLADNLDKRYFARAQMFPSIANKNYGIGVLGKYDMTANRNSQTGIMSVDYVSDWAGVIGVNHSFGGGILKIGATGKLIDRIQYTGNADPSAGSIKTKDLANEGMGLGVDVGFSLTSPTDYLPTLAVMAKDVGNTSFGLGSGLRNYNSNTDPTAIPMSVDVALAIFPINSQYLRSTFTVEYDDVSNNLYKNFSTKQKLHGGVEINLVDQLFFRAGYNRGYLTGGLEWAIRNLQFQLAYYGEEVGTETAPIKDERVAVKIAIRF
jgi:hypothetical protein